MKTTIRALTSFSLVLLALTLVTSPASAQLFFSQDDNANGLFKINTTTGQATLIASGSTGVSSSTIGLAPGDQPGTLFGSTYTDIHRISQDGSGYTSEGTASNEGLAYDPSSDTLWGAINGSFFSISTANFSTTTSLPSPVGGADIEGLAYDPNRDVVYGLAGFSGPMGELQEYDVATATWSIIGDTGIDFDLPGLAFDPANSILYAVGVQDDNLYRIDPTNAATVAIGATGLINLGTGTSGGGLAYIAIPEPSSLAIGLVVLGGLVFRGTRSTVRRV